MIEIKEIATEQTYLIRKEVLRKNIPLPFVFQGDNDVTTFHLGAFLNNNLIAVSSFVMSSHHLFEGSQYQLRGMATLQENQGMGVGKLLVEKSFEILRQKKINGVWCNARVLAVPFYEKLGFQKIGDEFEIQYVGGHYLMNKQFKYEI